MNIEIGLLILLILTISYCFYQQKTETFVSGNIYANLKEDIGKMNTIRNFFEKLTFIDDKYYLDGNEFNCVVGTTNIIDEDTVV